MILVFLGHIRFFIFCTDKLSRGGDRKVGRRGIFVYIFYHFVLNLVTSISLCIHPAF